MILETDVTEQAPVAARTRSAAGTLTKADLIDKISGVLELTRKQAAAMVEYILNSMVRALDRGEKIEIRGFGSFRTRPRRARIGHNPKTGVKVEVPAKRIVAFKASQDLLKSVQKQ
jgi:integration host factor subunit beta